MKVVDLLLAVVITAVWGVNFSVIKLGLNNVDPFILAGLRFALCALPLVFFIKKPDVPFKVLALYGFTFGVGLWGAINLSIELGMSAGITSLVLQFSAFITIFLGVFFLKEKLTAHQVVGFIVALFGLIVILQITDGSVNYTSVVLVIFAAASMAATNVIIKKTNTKQVFAFLVWSSLFSPIPLFLLGYLFNGEAAFIDFYQAIDTTAVFSILFQAYPTTLIAYWVWNHLLRKYPVSQVAPLSLLVPSFGLLSSAIIFGESISLIKIAACSLILMGLVVGLYGEHLINQGKKLLVCVKA